MAADEFVTRAKNIQNCTNEIIKMIFESYEQETMNEALQNNISALINKLAKYDSTQSDESNIAKLILVAQGFNECNAQQKLLLVCATKFHETISNFVMIPNLMSYDENHYIQKMLEFLDTYPTNNESPLKKQRIEDK